MYLNRVTALPSVTSNFGYLKHPSYHGRSLRFWALTTRAMHYALLHSVMDPRTTLKHPVRLTAGMHGPWATLSNATGAMPGRALHAIVRTAAGAKQT